MKLRITRRSCLLAMLLVTGGVSTLVAADGKELPTFTDPAKAGIDFELQGEYATSEGEKHGVQVIALGNGKFRAVHYDGGLPGADWMRGDKMDEPVNGTLKDGAAVFEIPEGSAVAKDGVLTVKGKDGNAIAMLKKVERKSPTLGSKPPKDAIVIFDGTSTDALEGGSMTDDKLLNAGFTTKQSFKDFHLHVEFRSPFMPTAEGQARGNSGCYLQDRYELQILDSFGLSGENNECGGFYTIKEPTVNMCLPPLAWQTYDIDFTAARFNDQGEKTSDATVTVLHNGVEIHKALKLPKVTPGGIDKEAPGVGPLKFQDHGNPVHYRNIWVVEKK